MQAVMKSLNDVKRMLLDGGYTLVIMSGEKLVTSRAKGIKPLLEAADMIDPQGTCFAADTVVGKAAAMLYAVIKADGVYGRVMSRPAVEIFEHCGIFCEYETLTDNIINRSGSGLCPMEEAVRNIEDPLLAKLAIRQKLSALQKKQVGGNNYDGKID